MIQDELKKKPTLRAKLYFEMIYELIGQIPDYAKNEVVQRINSDMIGLPEGESEIRFFYSNPSSISRTMVEVFETVGEGFLYLPKNPGKRTP